MSNNLTPGQDYAVKFLTAKGFKLESSPIQLKRGNLVFADPLGNKWGIFKNGGYIRKQTPGADRWGVVYSQTHAGSSELADDEYMDLAEMISTKYNNDVKKEQKGKETFGKYHKKVNLWSVYKYRDGFRVKDWTCYVPIVQIKKALDIIGKENFNDLRITQRFETHQTENAIEVSGWKFTPLAQILRITFFNNSDSIGYTKVTKQRGKVEKERAPVTWSKPEIISL